MTAPSIFLIEENALLRAGLRSILEGGAYRVIGDAAHVGGFVKASLSESPALIVMGVPDCARRMTAAMHDIADKARQARLILLTPHTDRQAVITGLQSRAAAILPKDLSKEALIAYLDLVMTGEKVCPQSCVAPLMNGDQDNAQIDGYKFSAREVEIIRCLCEGQSNKMVARNLDITVATVKVHLKTILRKSGFANRTQIATWAVQNGLTPTAHDTPPQRMVN